MAQGRRSGLLKGICDLAGSKCVLCLLEELEGVEGPFGQPRHYIGRDPRDSSEYQFYRFAALTILRLCEACVCHFRKDSPDSFAKFACDSKVGTDPRDERVTGIPRDVEGIVQINEARKSAG